MVVKEVLSHHKDLAVNFVVFTHFFVVACGYGGEHHLRELRENAIVIVFTNSEVNVIARNHVMIQLANSLNMLPLLLIDICLNLLLLETVPKLE